MEKSHYEISKTAFGKQTCEMHLVLKEQCGDFSCIYSSEAVHCNQRLTPLLAPPFPSTTAKVP